MKQQNYQDLKYDQAGDVLDVFFAPNLPVWTIELTDNIMLSIDRKTRRAIRLTLLDFTELIRPTPFGPRSFPLTGLADLPIHERDLVVKVLTSSPVNQWLDISSVQTLPDSPFAVAHLEPLPENVLNALPLAA